MFNRKSVISGLGLTALLMCSTASASLIVQEGSVDGDVGTENVLSNNCNGNVAGPATTVQGCLNSDLDFFVDFTSNKNLFIAGGQATLTAEEGNFSQLMISLAQTGYTFSKLQLNINASQDGFVTFEGDPGGFSNPFDLSRNGQNRFTITGESFNSVSLFTSVGVDSIDLLAEDLKQVRIGGVDSPSVSVPEPGSMFLLGLGLLSLGAARRRVAGK